ncbi:MAG: glycosyltransferase family 1 protein [Burkholderiaceae bacterium]|nr:glycosyltransferase family 1 protein [Burkholderiaceae bacterium]
MRNLNAPIEVDEYPAARQSLRIAVVTETYPPEVNGVAATIASFIEGLRARNHDVQLVRPRQKKEELAGSVERFHEVLVRGLPIPNYPHLKMGLPAKGALIALWKLRRPDLVHVVTEGPLGWSSIQAAAKLKIPVCSDFRTNFQSYSKHYGVGWLQKPIIGYLRKFHNRTRLTMVPTEAMRLQLQESGFNNVCVVARGVDTQLFTPQRRSTELRRSWGATAETSVVIHVGRLAAEKNLAALVQAYDAMRAADAALKLVFVGDGPARCELQNRCPHAIFTGIRSGHDLAAHYASGDMFLFPSTTETFGNVTPEAMASGLAVLAYDYAAAAQLIQPPRNGLLAPFDDTEAFVRLAADLASNRDIARAMGARARVTVEGLSWERVVEQLERLFFQVASEVEPKYARGVAGQREIPTTAAS